MNFSKLKELLNSLSDAEKNELINYLSSSNINLIEKRFKNGLYCPRCGCVENIVKYGFKNGHQRFRCKNCHRIFNEVTNSIFMCSKKSFDIWEKYIECMINEFNIRKSAKICGISITTAFVWRHKILDALVEKHNNVKLSGVVEVDETFFPISYKGCRKMPRPARKRGGTNVRGISKEQVCVPCGIDRNGNVFGKVSNLGKISKDKLNKVFGDRISDRSIICSDGEKSYKGFVKGHGYKHIVIKSGQYKNGIYHLNHINGYHNGLKGFIRRFNGVSTKYLNNYIVWNNIKKMCISIIDGIVEMECLMRYSTFANRPLIPIL